MASLAMLVGDAFAWSLDGRSVGEETQRHNKAIEDLQKARDEYNQRRSSRLDFINEDLRRQGHAVATFQSVDDAMREYHAVTGTDLSPLGQEPRLSDYYCPSDGQVSRESLFVVLGLAGTGLVAYELARREKKAA